MPWPNIPPALIGAWFAVLFLQSGLDKVTDFKGNLEWLNGHFAKSVLGKVVGPMLAAIAVVELFAGLMSAIGTVMLVTGGGAVQLLYGLQFSSLALLMLFFGQRVAKDYAGAAVLVPYFVLAIGGQVLLTQGTRL